MVVLSTFVCLTAVLKKGIDIKPKTKNSDEMLNFIMCWRTSGGTSFNSVLADSRSLKAETSKADILIITDGECEVDEHQVREFAKFKTQNKIDVRGFCIGKKSETMKKFCDEIVLVDTWKDSEMSDVFQKAIS